MTSSLTLRPLVLALSLAACQTALAASTSTSPAKPAPSPDVSQQQKDQTILQYAQIRQMEALGKRCGWFDKIEQQAVAASQQERLAWLQWHKADIAAAKAKAEAMIKQSQSTVCQSTASAKLRKGAEFGAWQMRSSWALRGYSMLPLADRPAWFAGKSSVGKHKAALQAAHDGLKTFSAKSIENSDKLFAEQTLAMLPVRCKQADKACPAAATDPGYRAYAEQVLALAEAYAAALEHVADKAGKPPKD